MTTLKLSLGGVDPNKIMFKSKISNHENKDLTSGMNMTILLAKKDLRSPANKHLTIQDSLLINPNISILHKLKVPTRYGMELRKKKDEKKIC